MKLVLGTYSSMEDYSADCDYALVDLTPALAARILARMDLAARLHQADASLYEVYYWDGQADFFAAPHEPAWEQWLPEDPDSFVELPDDVNVPQAALQSTEHDRLVINTVGPRVEVYWQSAPKHVFLDITTASLPRSLVEQVLLGPAGAGAAAQRV